MEEIDAGIEELHQSWRAAIRTGDIDAAIGLLTDDYVLWASGAPAIRGRESVRGILRAAIERFRIDPSFDAEECLLSGDLAVARGWDVQAIEPREGGETLTQRQRVFLVMRREQDGRWRYARGMSQPGPQPA